MLVLENIAKVFIEENQKTAALNNITLEINSGDFFVFIGPSGCGKSTLLRIIAGLENPSAGKITWSEIPKFGFVFQHFALFPYLTVFENIEFGLKMNNVPQKERKQIVDELIEEIGLTPFAKKHPKELSGGMNQRVGIARSLAISPNVLLLDEPFSSLDEFTAKNLRQLVLQIWQKRKITVLMVTHSISEALELADRIAVLTPRPATVEKIMVNDIKRPRNLRSKEFFLLEDLLQNYIKF